MKITKRVILAVVSSVMLSCNSQTSTKPKIVFNHGDYKKPDAFFKNKVTAAQKEGKWGWINPYGEWVIPAEYDETPKGWAKGLTVLKKGNFYGVLNAQNEIVYPFEYDKVFLEDAAGQPSQEPYVFLQKGDVISYVDFNGKTIDKPARYSLLNNSLLLKDENIGENEVNFQVVNKKGEVQLDFNASPFICWVGEFHDGYAPFFIGPYNRRSASMVDGLTYYGYVNTNGEMVIEPKYVANYMMMNTNDWLVTNPNFQFVNGEALIKAKDHYYAIDKKGNELRSYDQNYYNVGLPGKTGIRKAQSDYLDGDGNVFFKDGEKGWSTFGDFNSEGFAILKNAKEKKMKVVNSQMEEIFGLPNWDDEYYYEISPFWYDVNKYFVVSRVSIAEMKAAGIESYYDKPAGFGEYKLVAFDLSETDWMSQESKWMPTIGMYEKTNLATKKSEVFDLEGNKIFSCDTCSIWYLGSDQTNNRNQWLFKVRESDGSIHELGLNGFDFTKELDRYHQRFTEIDNSLFEEETNENPNFTLKFDEQDVKRYFKNLPGND